MTIFPAIGRSAVFQGLLAFIFFGPAHADRRQCVRSTFATSWIPYPCIGLLLCAAFGLSTIGLQAQSTYTTPYTFTTLAGTPGTLGATNNAAFDNPAGVVADSSGNVYVADSTNSAIRKITPTGMVSTFAGTPGLYGSVDATGVAARFSTPWGLAIDSAGNFYVADVGNATIRKITPAAVVTTLAGSSQNAGSADGTGSAAQFYAPHGVAADAAGNVFVADTGNKTIRKITPAGAVTTLAGLAGASGWADGTGGAARFNRPTGVAVDTAGNVFVADTENFVIRKITPAGVVTTLAGQPGVNGMLDGTGSGAQLNYPFVITIDSAGNLFVSEELRYTIRKITAAGVVTTIAGTPSKQPRGKPRGI